MGKLPRSIVGNTAILVCVDAFSKFVWLFPVREATTRTNIKAIKWSIFGSFSVPEVLVSDYAPCFTSREFRQFCFGLRIKHATTSPYYPQPSHAERFNLLTPNDHCSGRTAPLTTKRCILNIYSKNRGTEYFKHGIYSEFFPLK